MLFRLTQNIQIYTRRVHRPLSIVSLAKINPAVCRLGGVEGVSFALPYDSRIFIPGVVPQSWISITVAGHVHDDALKYVTRGRDRDPDVLRRVWIMKGHK